MLNYGIDSITEDEQCPCGISSVREEPALSEGEGSDILVRQK
ncbi:MAG: hypothetical protein JWN74_3283 [Acidobacteriaceae bacterium]|nr:hypothetical protein [Acidobacteriaceae bacterium]